MRVYGKIVAFHRTLKYSQSANLLILNLFIICSTRDVAFIIPISYIPQLYNTFDKFSVFFFLIFILFIIYQACYIMCACTSLCLSRQDKKTMEVAVKNFYCCMFCECVCVCECVLVFFCISDDSSWQRMFCSVTISKLIDVANVI